MVSTTSKDGTVITYSTTGTGPTIILVHGTLSTPANHSELVQDLSSDYTVVTYSRRSLALSAADPKASPPAL